MLCGGGGVEWVILKALLAAKFLFLLLASFETYFCGITVGA